MKAVILAGGLGTRMHPLTCDIPKPMLPFANRPIMAYAIDLLKKHGITDIVVLLYHHPQVIMDHFGDGSSFGVKLTYVTAPQNFGTAGAVKFALEHLQETFLVMSADVITDFDLTKIIEFHTAKRAAVTITLAHSDKPLQYGIVVSDQDGRIRHFLEKPSWGEVISDTINTGIYVINPIVLKDVPDDREIDFSKNVFPKLLEEREPVYGYVSEGYWKDIGSLSEYEGAFGDLGSGKFKIEGELTGNNVQISPKAVISGFVMIGDDVVIGDNVVLDNCIIGKGCTIQKGTRITETIIWDGAKIGADCHVTKSVIACNNKIGDRVILEEGVVVASNCFIGADTHVKPYVKIWPGKRVEEGATVSSSIVWRERWTSKIFGAHGVTGICNTEITPEFAATLGAAYGVMLGKGSHITTSRDPHKASRMIYRALLSGVLSAGVNVSDLELVPIPINRYELKAVQSKGGFHVRKSPFDAQVLDIKFFDLNGMDLPAGKEKAIERLFFGEDFERASIDDTGELSFPFHRVAERYKDDFLNAVDTKTISQAKFKFVIDYSYGSSSQIFPSILGELGCDVTAINAFIDDAKISKTKDEFDGSLNKLSQIVLTLKCNFGVMFDSGAEKIFLIDENGRLLTGDETLALFVYLNLKHNGNKVVATPVTSSRNIDDLAKQFRGRVVRTKSSFRALMEAAAEGAGFVGERQGGFIFPPFQVSFDSMLSTAKLLEYLAKEGRPVSVIMQDIPGSYISKMEIACPNCMKGRVMRAIIEDNGHNPIELIDGVKIYHKKDWALILPHSDMQSIRLQVESDSDTMAKKIMDLYSSRIYDMCVSVKEGG